MTFTCPKERSDEPESTITILERRYLISGSKTTGFRTWEGALHLGAYLLSRRGQDIIRGKKILELGAGTGFLAILCGKQLAAKHVTTTDGDKGVVEALKENLELNGLDEEKVQAMPLWWGDDLKGTWVERECQTEPYDVVIGADIVSLHCCGYTCQQDADQYEIQTYEPGAIRALVATLRQLFDLRPGLSVIIAGVVRNAHTYETFRHECCKYLAHATMRKQWLINFAVASGFILEEVNFRAKSIREQSSLFYAAAVPVKILNITRANDKKVGNNEK